jgi:hypothetical protein
MKRLKCITICCLLLSIQNFCVAQKSPAKFGKIKIKDLEMEKCSFEEGADAMVLFDYAKTSALSSKFVSVFFGILFSSTKQNLQA